MAYENSDFYCDTTKLSSLCGEYKTRIDELIQYYEHVKNKVAKIESEQSWKGDSFDSFKEAFQTVESDVLSTINAMIAFSKNLALVEQLVLDTIKMRNTLHN